ncbi:MAG TPA: exosporium protein, partial [Desulfosporosinus sp.]|nr:exosporium protein [Desulfosporosinus sp.]
MAELTTGLIENNLVDGIRPTSTFTVKVTNDGTTVADIEILGFFVSGGIKTHYAQELISLAAGSVTTRDYYAAFNAFEFKFITSSNAVKVSAWGKNAEGNLVAAHRVLPAELDPIGSVDVGATGATGATGEAGA